MAIPSRRTFLATAGSGLLASAAGCLSPATDRGVSGSWTHVGRTPARSSHAPDGSAPEPPLTTRWMHDFDGGSMSSPVVADGRVYVARLRYENQSDRDNAVSVAALDAASGEERWLTEAPLNTPVAVDDGRVVVSTAEETGEDDRLFTLRSFDAKTGDEKWRQRTPHTNFSEGAVVDGTVFLPDGELFRAFGTETGDERARPHTAERGGESLDSAPAIVDGFAFLTTNYNRVYAVESCSLGGGRYCLF